MNLRKKHFPKLNLYTDRKSRVYAIIGKPRLPKGYINSKKITYIQLRQKNVSSLSLIKTIKTLKKKYKRDKILLIINDRIDVALAANTHGLHIGRGDMDINVAKRILGRKYIIGKTVRNKNQAETAEKEGVDYVSIGPIFKTPLKKMKSRGIKTLRKVRRTVKIPVVAIGGINFSNMDRVFASGADLVAVMRGISRR